MRIGWQGRHVFVFLVLLSLLTVCRGEAEPGKEKTEEELKKNADAAIQLGTSIDGVAKMQDLFDYTDYLLKAGKNQEARKYIKEALLRKPWALAYQLTYAKILQEAGDKAEADERIKFVIEHAEDDETQMNARRLSGLEASPALEPFGPVPEDGIVLIFVPIGTFDKLLILDVAQSLQERLGIPVLVRDAHIVLPPATRDKYALYMDEMRKRVMAAANDPQLVQALKEQGVKLTDLSNNDVLESFIRKSVATAGREEDYHDLCSMLDELKKNGKQWDTKELEKKLGESIPQLREGVYVIEVTNLDIYSSDCNFVYFDSWKTHSVFSYGRYCARNNNDPPDRKRLMSRIRKACLGCFGLMGGVVRCSNPTCPVAFQMTLQEHDAKTENYCPSCLKTMEAVLGHPIKTAPAQ